MFLPFQAELSKNTTRGPGVLYHESNGIIENWIGTKCRKNLLSQPSEQQISRNNLTSHELMISIFYSSPTLIRWNKSCSFFLGVVFPLHSETISTYWSNTREKSHFFDLKKKWVRPRILCRDWEYEHSIALDVYSLDMQTPSAGDTPMISKWQNKL
jgi:hypothetical protein